MVLAASFAGQQLEYPRVRVARDETTAATEKMFEQAGVPFPPEAIYIRIFKQEMQLELWVQPKSDDTFRRLKVYDICSTSGVLGPKRQQGDLQIPEGYYRINHFNPWSTFYLSLGINYPNRSDRILKSGSNPGGSIYIHGDCVTIGCVPITDPQIKELYWIAVKTRDAGQARIPVHIFPFHLTDEALEAAERRESEHVKFWRGLKPGYDWFERKRTLPKYTIDEKGRYRFRVRSSN